ncbi:rhamnan synthesis F family protein [Herbiconiux sp. YIM B11900]|uniref:rhamnan synthesis F family protein n=1 Tax=Herbiconiux sp. YIM B11900 TaxID=3404131 RepID=UPI003F86F4B4
MASGNPDAVGIPRLDPGHPEALFDAAWYLASYPDVAAEIGPGAAWAHFVLHGEAEGRSPGPDFDAEFYRRTHLPLEGDFPFTHYVAEGRRRGHAPRVIDASDEQTRSGIRAALRGRLNPVLLLGNDARSAGGPLLLLEIATRLRARGRSPIFVLKQGGPLFSRFAALGPTLIADEGWDLRALGAELPPSMPVLANTSWGALLAQRLGVAGRSVVLVHEMPDYILAQDLLGPISQAHTVITSMPRIEAELNRLLESATAPAIETVLPGLQAPAVSAGGTARIRREIASRFGDGNPVFLGAGYADQRKGFDLFLAAARAIAAREPLAGFIWLGDLGAWARSLASEAQASGLRLLLPGFRTDAGDWYASTDVYLLTSRQDPGPTTVMDAARLGVPFVGLAADIGLRELAEITAATGEFVDTTDEVAERAMRRLGTETAATRKARAAFVREYRSFDGYVDDLERALGEATPASVSVGRLTRGRARARLMVLDVRSSPVPAAVARTVADSVDRAVRRAKRLAPSAGALAPRPRRPVSIAVAQDALSAEGREILPASVLTEPAAVAALRPGARAWVSTPVLLSAVSEEVDLHILRRPGAEPWQLVKELELAGRRIGRVTQHDLGAAPRWAVTGAPPPRPRRLRGGGEPPQPPVAPAPHGPVRLPRRIGVFVHVYYVDLAGAIADRLALIEHPISLYVSTDDERKAAEIRRMLPSALVRVVPNQGRDIAPKVFGFAPEHAEHDVVLHLHTKRSPHRGDLAGWFDHLLDCLLPSSEGIDAILGLFADSPTVGLVGPAWFSGLSPTVLWGPNRAIAEVLTWNAGWPPLPDDRYLSFAAGSMFWARSSALRPLQALAIPPEAFGDSAATDGTLAHAVERLIGVSCSVAGLEQLFVLPPADQRAAVGGWGWEGVNLVGSPLTRRLGQLCAQRFRPGDPGRRTNPHGGRVLPGRPR